MNWFQKTCQEFPELESDSSNIVQYPMAGGMVGGLRVLEQVNNMASIGASFRDYEILDGVREISMSEFSSPKPQDNFYANNDFERCHSLAEEIRNSGEIMPLIVAIDDEGPYILEGGHRFVSLYLLGIQSFPALVVIDKD